MICQAFDDITDNRGGIVIRQKAGSLKSGSAKELPTIHARFELNLATILLVSGKGYCGRKCRVRLGCRAMDSNQG